MTHTLRVTSESAELAVALVVREIPGADLRDATSTYGYPGAAVRGHGAAPDPLLIDWSGAGLVSVFARDRLAREPFLARGTRRSMVQVHDPGRPRELRRRFRGQIRHNARAGYRVDAVPGPETTAAQRADLHRAYSQTMRRAGAEGRYLYEARYFDRILAFERSWLLVCAAPGCEAAAGAVAALSDGLLHYYLGGTADAHLACSPFKNVVEAMVALAGELAVPLNLGGGMRPGDGLEDFKRGFANSELPFFTHELICDPAAYDRLTPTAPAAEFFPAYRAA